MIRYQFYYVFSDAKLRQLEGHSLSDTNFFNPKTQLLTFSNVLKFPNVYCFHHWKFKKVSGISFWMLQTRYWFLFKFRTIRRLLSRSISHELLRKWMAQCRGYPCMTNTIILVLHNIADVYCVHLELLDAYRHHSLLVPPLLILFKNLLMYISVPLQWPVSILIAFPPLQIIPASFSSVWLLTSSPQPPLHQMTAQNSCLHPKSPSGLSIWALHSPSPRLRHPALL